MTLRERREALNMTQEAIAKKLEVDQSTVSLWETKNAVPKKKDRRKLSRLYQCSADDLAPVPKHRKGESCEAG